MKKKAITTKLWSTSGRFGQGSEYYANARIHMAYIYESRKQYDEAIEVLEKPWRWNKEESSST
jgi:hypothetical protein